MININIIQNFIPVGRRNRPATSGYYKGYKVYGLVMKPTTITIHNAYTKANAKGLSDYCKSIECSNRPASWHLSIDENEAWQSVPFNEPSWHAGDGASGPGNLTSISIEIVDRAMLASPRNEKLYLQAEEHAAKVCAYLIKTIPTLKPFPECMRQHWHWSGKNCPQWIRARKNGWQEFIDKVRKYLTTTLHRVVCGSFTTWEAADKHIEALSKAGFNSFTVGFNYNKTTYIRVICGAYSNRDNADKQVSVLKAKGFDSFIVTHDGKDDPLPPRQSEPPKEEPKPEPPKEDTVVYRVIINGKQVIALTGFEKAKEYALSTYPNDEIVLQNVDTNEKIKIQDAKPKSEPPKPEPEPTPEPKPEYKYNILGKSEVTLERAIQWAKNRNTPQTFIDVADLYWDLAPIKSIKPEILYAQNAHETNFMRYTGVVPASYNNMAGIKIAQGGSCSDPLAHESFDSPADGVKAHISHICAYVGQPPFDNPHGRYYVVAGLPWAGSIKYLEELSGKWAPSATYHTKIAQFLEEMLATEVVPIVEPEPEPEPDPVEPIEPEPKPEKPSLISELVKLLQQLVELINKFINLLKGGK